MATQKKVFQAEIKEVLDIVIHSLYSKKEVFLRELISNASDALDKFRVESLTDETLKGKFDEALLEIRLGVDEKAGTLLISDNGIGMNEEEVIKNLGTIAHSGTKEFLKMKDELKANPELIGQFGVGFYAAFMVAKKVVVHTQREGAEGVLWTSEGLGEYEIEKKPRPEEGRGTTITLFLKEEETDTEGFESEKARFTDRFEIRSIVKRYSDFISYPIRMKGEETDEVLNSQKAIWLKSASEITEEEYTEFYHHLTHDFSKPLKTIHFKAEGLFEYSSLLYIPSQKPWNYNYGDSKYGLNLYVKKVFIMGDCENLIPPYLRFMKGLVDSSDLSLNISREMLQKDRQVEQIRKSLTSKILGILSDLLKLDRTSYELFWKEFGSTLKEGIGSDAKNQKKIEELLLFHTTDSDGLTTFQEYISRMKPDQKAIYFITGGSVERLKGSSHYEKIKEKGYEVLLCTDPVDEWVMTSIPTVFEKPLQSVLKADLEIESEEEKKEAEEKIGALTKEFQGLFNVIKTALGSKVQEVKLSQRLTSSPACLVSSPGAPTPQMQKVLKAMGQPLPESKPILELNPEHPVVTKLKTLTPEKQQLWSEILYGQCLINDGIEFENPHEFSKKLSELLLDS